MRPSRSLLLLVPALLLTPAPAGAAPKPCPKRAIAVADPSGITDYHDGAPEGGPLLGGKVRYPGHFFKTAEDLELTVKGNRYEIEAGSIFKLGCYGKSIKAPNRYPALLLLAGEVRVRTSARHPGGVATEEGLYDPRDDPSMTFTVERTLRKKGDPTVDEMLAWFANFRDQPHGTTTVESGTKGAIVGVTPYVGNDPGRCRYVKSARLTTRNDRGEGSASYER